MYGTEQSDAPFLSPEEEGAAPPAVEGSIQGKFAALLIFTAIFAFLSVSVTSVSANLKHATLARGTDQSPGFRVSNEYGKVISSTRAL